MKLWSCVFLVTSNGIESNNRNIKEDDTFRERWPLGRFCVKSLDIVRNWSADRNPTNVNCKNFNFHPILETKEFDFEPILIFIRTLSLFYGSYGYIKIQTRPIGWKI
jgi:hypothetical protein